MVSFHRKRTLTKTEVSARECGIAVLSLIPDHLWGAGLEKPLNFKSSVKYSVETQKMRMLIAVRAKMEACLVSQGSK